MPKITYSVPNFKSPNSYDIREFDALDAAALAQIQKDYELLQASQSYEQTQHKKYFKRSDGLFYLAEQPHEPSERNNFATSIEVDNPFILIKAPNGTMLQYRKDAFTQLEFYAESAKKAADEKQARLGDEHEAEETKEEPFVIQVKSSLSFTSIIQSLQDWFGALLQKLTTNSSVATTDTKQSNVAAASLAKSLTSALGGTTEMPITNNQNDQVAMDQAAVAVGSLPSTAAL